MRRFCVGFLLVVCLFFACLLVQWTSSVQAEEQKKGKWYDIFKGKSTGYEDELQLRKEELELRKLEMASKQGTHTDLHNELEAKIRYLAKETQFLYEAQQSELKELRESVEAHKRAIEFIYAETVEKDHPERPPVLKR